MVALGVQGIAGHRDTRQVKGVHQGDEAGDCVGLLRDSELGDGHPGDGHRAQQLGGRGAAQARAAARLPSRVSVPAGPCPRRSARPPGQVSLMTRRMVAPLGGTRPARAVAVRAPNRARTSCGASAAHSLIAARLLPRSPQRSRRSAALSRRGDASRADTADRPAWPAARPTDPSRGDDGGRLDQTDGGRLAAHRSSIARRGLGKVTFATELRLRVVAQPSTIVTLL